MTIKNEPADAPAQGTPEPPKVEEFVQTFLSRLAGLTEEQSSNVAETLTHSLRPYFPPASQTPTRDAVKWLEDIGYGVNGKFALDSKRNWQGYEIKEILELFALGFPESGRIDPLATPASTARTDGWVSVEESGLPKVGHWCWVVYHGVVQRMAAHLAGKGFACADGYEWRWTDDSADPCPLEEITHWRELPAAPGSVEKE